MRACVWCLVVIGLVGCGGGGLGAGGRVPAQHKPADGAACPVTTRQASPCQMSGASCSVDGDCTAGINGRCTPRGAALTCGCVYDACGSDAECPGGLCACNPFNIGNVCVTASCQVDTDCGPSGFCGPVIEPCNLQIVGYKCHSASDTCVNDADCASGETCAAYDGDERWICRPPAICA